MGLNKCDEQNNLKAENWNDFRAFYMDTFVLINFTFMADFWRNNTKHKDTQLNDTHHKGPFFNT